MDRPIPGLHKDYSSISVNVIIDLNVNTQGSQLNEKETDFSVFHKPGLGLRKVACSF